MTDQIKTVVDQLAKGWEDFKAADAATKGRTEAERKEMLDKINSAIAAAEEAKKSAEMAATKAGRLGVGTAAEVDPAKAEHKKAFLGFMRKGNESGLRELEAKAVNLTTLADGGYALPEEIASDIQKRIVDISPIRQIATVVQVGTSDYKRLVDRRGFASGWVGEAAARTATNTGVLQEVPASMGEVYANPQVTQQALDDIFFNVEAWVAESVATEFARAEGAAFVVGNGTNQPAGFLNGATAATADSARAAGTIEHVPTGVAGDFAASNKGDVLISLVYKLKAGHRNGAAFVTNKGILAEVRAFKDAQGQYVWAPGLAPGAPSTLMGYPVYEAEDMPVKAANALSIAFGNFKAGYCIVDRVGVRTLRDPFTNKPYVGFYTTKRVGGMLLDSEAIKVVKFAIA